MSKLITGAAYGAVACSVANGFLTRLSPDEWSAIGVLAGVFVGLLTFIINWYYKRKATLAQISALEKRCPYQADTHECRYGLSPGLRNKLLAAAGSGALLIATLLLKSEDGLEGREYIPYKDVPGILIVCDRHTSEHIIPGKTYTDKECDLLLDADLAKVRKSVDRLVAVQTNDYQRAALYSFAFNVGVTAFSHSTLLSKLNAGDHIGACYEFRRWIYADKKTGEGWLNSEKLNVFCASGRIIMN